MTFTSPVWNKNVQAKRYETAHTTIGSYHIKLVREEEKVWPAQSIITILWPSSSHIKIMMMAHSTQGQSYIAHVLRNFVINICVIWLPSFVNEGSKCLMTLWILTQLCSYALLYRHISRVLYKCDGSYFMFILRHIFIDFFFFSRRDYHDLEHVKHL